MECYVFFNGKFIPFREFDKSFQRFNFKSLLLKKLAVDIF